MRLTLVALIIGGLAVAACSPSPTTAPAAKPPASPADSARPAPVAAAAPAGPAAPRPPPAPATGGSRSPRGPQRAGAVQGSPAEPAGEGETRRLGNRRGGG